MIAMSVQAAELPSVGRNHREGETLWDVLVGAVRTFPSNPALVMKPGVRRRVTTYAELEHLAARCGRLLQDRGVAVGDRVMIWAPNMPQWVAMYFGCMKIGAVVVPLDVRSEGQFAAAVARQTEPKLLVASRLTAHLSDGLTVP